MKKNIIKKNKIVTDVQSLFNTSVLSAVVEFSKITSLEFKNIRQNFKKKSMYIKSVKNTLIKKALLGINSNFLIEKIPGQKILIFGNDIQLFFGSLQDISNLNNNLKINSLYLYGRTYSGNSINELKNIRSKEDTIIRLTFILKLPIIKFIKTLKYSYVKLLILLKLIEIKNKGEKRCL